MPRVLIATSSERIAAVVETGLRANGFTAAVVTDGVAALAAAAYDTDDMVVLDMDLRAPDGLTVLRAMRAAGARLPVIILTSEEGMHDAVAGLEAGADDQMSKPFRFEELLARIRLRLQPALLVPEVTVLRHGELRLDLRTRRAITRAVTVELTARESALLETFLRYPGEVLSRERILAQVWGYDFEPDSNVVEVYVRLLRGKLGPDIIRTVRGMGYTLS